MIILLSFSSIVLNWLPCSQRKNVKINGKRANYVGFTTTNTLYYGDNLDILRRYFPSESVDLIYLDPPFNSKADYNVLFKEKSGEQSTAQIQAFSDFWQWDTAARDAYDYLVMSNEVNNNVGNLADAFYRLFWGKVI